MSVDLKSKINILYIDDEKESLQLVNTFLHKLNPDRYNIVGITDVNEGIGHMLSNKYDIVISDLNLSSDLNGLDLFIFMNSSKKWKKVPFIIFSGSGIKGLHKKLKSHGINHYISKQGNPEKIFKNLNETIIKSYRDAGISSEFLKS